MKSNKTSAKYRTSLFSYHFDLTKYNFGHVFNIYQYYSDKLSG